MSALHFHGFGNFGEFLWCRFAREKMRIGFWPFAGKQGAQKMQKCAGVFQALCRVDFSNGTALGLIGIQERIIGRSIQDACQFPAQIMYVADACIET